jgi:predicted RNA-binding protein Jag
MTDDLTQPVMAFLEGFTSALGIDATISVEDSADGPRINIGGDEAEILARHRGEPIKALQYVVDMAFGRGLPDGKRLFVYALEYRRCLG